MENKKLVSTVGFVGVIVVVLGSAVYFGSRPSNVPNMPSNHPEYGANHSLRVNLKGELLGTENEPPVDIALASQPGFALDKRAAEKRVNTGCKECHAKLSEHHPPKQECIKCHRMSPKVPAGATPPAMPATPPATPPAPPPAAPPTP